MRKSIADVEVSDGGISASIGVTTFACDDIEAQASFIDAQISAADRALYVAKESGRGRVAHSARLDAG